MENMRLGASQQSGERLSKALFKGIWGGQEKKITAEADVLLSFAEIAKEIEAEVQRARASADAGA